MRLTLDHPGSGGILRAAPEDFRVDEILPYAPSGAGEHLFVRIEKRGIDTLTAVRRICRHLGLPDSPIPKEVGMAGLKDRHADATQWLSLPWKVTDAIPTSQVVESGPSSQLKIIEVLRHKHKLRRGHVAANRFDIVIRQVPLGGTARARTVLAALRDLGVPNRFGPQRFGRLGDNADRAREVLRGRARRPREGRLWKLLCSALQAEAFNRLLEMRLERGLLTTALVGDRMTKHASGGEFLVDDAEREQVRVDRLEISPTGPLPGRRTPPSGGKAAELEMQAVAQAGIEPSMVDRLGPGGRRALRYPLDPAAEIRPVDSPDQEEAYRLAVTLPSGAYATVLLDELAKPEDGPFRRQPPSEGGSSESEELA